MNGNLVNEALKASENEDLPLETRILMERLVAEIMRIDGLISAHIDRANRAEKELEDLSPRFRVNGPITAEHYHLISKMDFEALCEIVRRI